MAIKYKRHNINAGSKGVGLIEGVGLIGRVALLGKIRYMIYE